MCQNTGYYKDVLVWDASQWWCSWLHLELHFIASSARYVEMLDRKQLGPASLHLLPSLLLYFSLLFSPIDWDGNVNQIQSLHLTPSSEIGSPVCKQPVLIVLITSCCIWGNLLTRFNKTFQCVKEVMEFGGLYL